jgi:hypothetical protein
MRTRTNQRSRPGLRSAATAVLLGSLTLALAACGKGDDDAGAQVASLGETATTAPSGDGGDGAAADDNGDDETESSVDPEDAFLEFAKCMREHGVDMDDPVIDGSGRGAIAIGGGPGSDGGDGPDRETLDAAQEACQPLLDDVVSDRQAQMDPEEIQQMQDEALEFSKCMREHGIDFPDPVFGDGGTVSISLGEPGGGGLDPQSEEFQAAQEECGRNGGFIGARPVDADGGSTGDGPVSDIQVDSGSDPESGT